MKRPFITRLPAYSLVFSMVTLSLCLSGAESPAASFSRAVPLMGTLIEITVETGTRKAADRIIDEAFKEIARVDEMMSSYRQDSEVSLLSRRAGEAPVRVSPVLMEVLEASMRYYSMSGGAFDVTVGPLLRLWGFRSGGVRVPSGEEISSVRPLVGSERVVLDRDLSTAYLPYRGMEIDLGGIAKGYAVDRAVSVLRSAGISEGVVNAGGDLFVLGHAGCPAGTPVGIRDPLSEGKLLGWVKVSEAAVATSGSYENFFVHDGVAYSHIIDPRRGEPVRGVLSVTVISPSAMQADALATALFVMGPREGVALAGSMPGVEALMVSPTPDGAGLSLSATSGFHLNESALVPAECPP